MIRYLSNSEIDYDQWDECINKALNGTAYALSWYLDTVCEDWNALVFGDYEMVMPIASRKRYGIAYLYHPPFAQQLGVFSASTPTNVSVNDFLDVLSSRFRFAEIALNRHNNPSHTDFAISMYKNYELELIQPIEDLRRKYADNTSRNIRRAENHGISISENVDPKSLIRMFREEKGDTLSRLDNQHYLMIEKLMYRAIYKQMALLAGAYDTNNQLCAGAFLLKYKNRLIFLFSANNTTARNSGAMHMLVDRIISKFSGQPFILDFEGSEIPGLARFYASFGSTLTHYPFLTFNRLPLPAKLALKVMKALKLK